MFILVLYINESYILTYNLKFPSILPFTCIFKLRLTFQVFARIYFKKTH